MWYIIEVFDSFRQKWIQGDCAEDLEQANLAARSLAYKFPDVRIVEMSENDERGKVYNF